VSINSEEVQAADKRVALVVGNSAYQNVSRLDNPVNDARLMADTLRSVGFSLVGGAALTDLDKGKFDSAVQNFGNQIAGADVALFYYAGHGVQVRGSNHLVPVNANPTREADVDFQMVDVALVLRQMEGSGTKLNLVILDACRNNPFGGRGLRATEGGLAQMRAPEGTLISYATQPGNVALDGADGNSPYTKALAQTLRRPALGIFDVFNEVGLAVKRSTGGSQQPWVSSSPIDGRFYFVAAPTSLAEPPLSGAPFQTNEAAQAWTAAKETTNPAVLEAFIQRYGDSFYANLARARLEEIRAVATKSPQVASIPPTGDASPKSIGPSSARQRVVLYDEDPTDKRGKQYVGMVVWRTEQIKAANGQPDIAVRADIEIPDRKFKMTMSFRRNLDSSLPASHTVELTVILPADFTGGGVGNVPGILMKSNEQARGTPLAGLAVKVSDGFFLVGLSNVKADRVRNIQLLRERLWFDVPLVYANQRRAIIAIEKGPPGEQAFADAFSSWGQVATNEQTGRPVSDGLQPAVVPKVQTTSPLTAKAKNSESRPAEVSTAKRALVIPDSVAPKYSTESDGDARMHTCLDQYIANKATNSWWLVMDTAGWRLLRRVQQASKGLKVTTVGVHSRSEGGRASPPTSLRETHAGFILWRDN
jgi:Caspase domain